MGIVSSNAILASIVKAVGVDMSETFGGKIFAISAQPANKYRHYVDANTYLPTTDQITFYLNDSNQLIAFGEGPSDEYHEYIANYKTYLETAKNGRKVTIPVSIWASCLTLRQTVTFIQGFRIPPTTR